MYYIPQEEIRGQLVGIRSLLHQMGNRLNFSSSVLAASAFTKWAILLATKMSYLLYMAYDLIMNYHC